jgi:imidazolonepropionase-like amidohydrolase
VSGASERDASERDATERGASERGGRERGLSERGGRERGNASYALHVGTLIDPAEGTIERDMVVLIDGSSISGVLPAAAYGRGDGREVHDARGRTLLPGLIDAHVHISYDPDPDGSWKEQDLSASLGYLAIQGGVFARRTLEAGFTTVRDLGARGYANLAVRDAIDAGLIPGCRVMACGLPLCATGGHFDHAAPYRNVEIPERAELVDSPDDARRAVRRQLRRGADLIKIAIDGRVGSSFDPRSTEWQELSRPELEAICRAAHEAGRQVAAHTGGGRGLMDAIEAGIDSLEHLQGFDDAVFDALAERGTFLVPTLTATRCTVDRGVAPQAPKGLERRALEWMARNWDEKREAMGRARAAGVRMALGTDAGYVNCLHGDNAYELELLAETGLTAMEALRCATSEAAACLGWGDHLGRIAPGYRADLLLLDADPSRDVSVLRGGRAIDTVIKDGAMAFRRAAVQKGP